MAAALDQDLAVASVRVSDGFLVTAVQLASLCALAIEGSDDVIRLTVL
jgi:hypothetical protein